MKNSAPKSIWLKHKIEFLIFAGGLLAIHAIFISKTFRQSSTIDPETASQFGTFVGGYIGPIFALAGVLLLFATLKSQQQSSTLDNFETKYFELIKMHRDNVSEIEITGDHGRKVFVLLLREWRCILEVVQEIAGTCGQQLTQLELVQVAYYCLFFGVGQNSSRMLKLSLSSFEENFVDTLATQLDRQTVQDFYKADREFKYMPFEGHQSRLGHYYRHLYQMVRYVDQQDIEINKYEYVKTIRAQLSTHEQALLLINSLTPIGENWWAKKLMLEYRLVKNIPREFFDKSTELDMDKLFQPGYFEWEKSSPGDLLKENV